MQFKDRTLNQLADMICGNFEAAKSFFVYRSSSYITEFFQDCDTDYRHDGSTRRYWVAETLRQILAEPHPSLTVPPDTFARVIRTLMDPSDAINEGPDNQVRWSSSIQRCPERGSGRSTPTIGNATSGISRRIQ
jgi:hypothetical protein